MTRAEFLRRLHEARVEGYSLAVYDTGPKPLTSDQETRWRRIYRDAAERKIGEYERAGRFTADTVGASGIERVA